MRLAVVLISLQATTADAQDFTTLKGHGGPIMGLDISASGQVVSASFDNAVGLWSDRTPQWLDAHDAAVIAVRHLPDGRIVSGGDDFSVQLWDNGTPTRLGRHKGKVTSFALIGDTIASGSWDGTIGLWPLWGDDPPRILDIGRGNINDLAVSPDGQTLYAATSAGDILAVSLTTDAAARVLVRHGFAITKLALAPDAGWLAYGAVDGVTRVMNPETGEDLRDFSLERRPILAMRYHEPTGQLAVGDGQGYIMMIDTDRWRITRDFRATRKGPVWALAFTPDGQTLYAGGLDDVIYGWPVDLMNQFDPGISGEPNFLRDTGAMPNGERQFMRKCSICHALTSRASRKAGPTLHGLFGRPAGTVPGYRYSDILVGSPITWNATTIDALFDLGPDQYIPGSKMPMQRITKPQDRKDLITFLEQATQ